MPIMSKWPKKPLLAVLAALTAVGLAIPSAWADTTAPGAEQPGIKVTDPSANDDMVIDMNGRNDGREANSGSNLELSDEGAGGMGRQRSMSRAASPNQALVKGQIMSGVHDIEDPSTSVYVGGNMRQVTGTETEGSVVVNGNLYIGPGAIGQGLLAGKVMWGMGFNPPAGADMLAIGGDYINYTGVNPQWVGGATRIGGKMEWATGAVKNQNNN